MIIMVIKASKVRLIEIKMQSSRDKIESLRDLINTIIVSEDYDADYLLEKSQELDILIVQAVKEMNFSKKVFGYKDISEFDVFLDEMKMLRDKYYSIRIIDPVTEEVLELKKGDLYTNDCGFYKIFKKNYICENFTLTRAWDNDETSMKIERFNNKVFLVAGIPILIHGKKLLVELFEDISSFKDSNDFFCGKNIKISV